MSKAILISIKPKYVADILNGQKTIEIRKTMPKCDLPIDVYIYCTKDKNLAWYKDCLPIQKWNDQNHILRIERLKDYELNGKVVAKFTLRKVEEISRSYDESISSWRYYENEEVLEEQACLDNGELQDYLDMKNGYAWRIDNLVIFDKPKELSEFKVKGYERVKVMGNPYNVSFFGSVNYHHEKKIVLKPLTKAPQSYCFIESEE